MSWNISNVHYICVYSIAADIKKIVSHIIILVLENVKTHNQQKIVN